MSYRTKVHGTAVVRVQTRSTIFTTCGTAVFRFVVHSRSTHARSGPLNFECLPVLRDVCPPDFSNSYA